ncbi:TetR family transcriptional regulator [Izhakiella australiensis]|uniref:TetR family transcriptional regulator n=1 Tax=Izhakiella australiensis TaxID=1926881 RepID=A0A1S8YPG0_9GAMM|nr:TetR/AcrR family transcriptional regulator [Izhakiella australiensis]OON41031.1 TetR family transcriptional regulator [Izhakiella australiensis]
MTARSRQQSMEENRSKLIAAARKAFALKGFSAASMDDLTASVGLTRGALYHNFGDKKGLLAAVVSQVDAEIALRAKQIAASAGDDWNRLLAEGIAYIEMALEPEVQRIVLLDGPAFLGDPGHWPSQNLCLAETRKAVAAMIAKGIIKPLDVEAVSRLLNGAAFNAALWVAASDAPEDTLSKATETFRALANGLLVRTAQD